MALSAWPSRRTHRRDEPMVSSNDASALNARPDTLAGPQPSGLQGESPCLAFPHWDEKRV
jgi:hypothetical protein